MPAEKPVRPAPGASLVLPRVVDAAVQVAFERVVLVIEQIRTLASVLFTATRNGAVRASGGGTANFLRADHTWAVPPGTGGGGSGVPTSRLITTTAPLTIDGVASADLSADRTLAVSDFTATTHGTAPPSGGGVLNFLRADASWAAPALQRFDTVIDMTGSPITFGPAFDAWNVGALGQNTLIQYITDGVPLGSSSRQLRGVAGGSYGKTITLMNMSTFTGIANLTHETGAAGSAFHNAGLASVGGGGTGGSVTYWHDGTLWREIGTT